MPGLVDANQRYRACAAGRSDFHRLARSAAQQCAAERRLGRDATRAGIRLTWRNQLVGFKRPIRIAGEDTAAYDGRAIWGYDASLQQDALECLQTLAEEMELSHGQHGRSFGLSREAIAMSDSLYGEKIRCQPPHRSF